MDKYQPVIGLEVHVELKTKSKMFCGCSADYFGKGPNTHTCPICLGLPGALPFANKLAIDWCVMIGLALNCQVPLFSRFDRKNYFYPDLPKGYQISQYDQPFCINGSIVLENGKKVGIRRVHMEEDTAKLTHATVDGEKVSLIDFNRSGVPLVEIVTEPDFENTEEVVEYLKKLQQIVRHLGVSNADMEKGDMRLEPNISLKPVVLGSQASPGSVELPKYKVEVKNINSFRFVGRAIEYEIKRQDEILEKGEIPAQETRGWNETQNVTLSQRSKEEAHDYRYFPEPDLPPIRWEEEQIEQLRSQIKGKMPEEKIQYITTTFGISLPSTTTMVNMGTASLFEETMKIGQPKGIDAQGTANFIINRKIDPSVSPAQIVSDIMAKSTNIISNEKKLEKVIKEVLEENAKVVEAYKSGKENALQVLIGAVMKKTVGKADVGKVKEILISLLK